MDGVHGKSSEIKMATSLHGTLTFFCNILIREHFGSCWKTKICEKRYHKTWCTILLDHIQKDVSRSMVRGKVCQYPSFLGFETYPFHSVGKLSHNNNVVGSFSHVAIAALLICLGFVVSRIV